MARPINVSHYWSPEGAGEFSRRWVRPLCNGDSTARRHESTFTGTEDSDSTRCADCVAIATALGINLARRTA